MNAFSLSIPQSMKAPQPPTLHQLGNGSYETASREFLKPNSSAEKAYEMAFNSPMFTGEQPMFVV